MEDQQATPMLEECNSYSNKCDKTSSSTISSIDDYTYVNKDSTPQLHFEVEIDCSEPPPHIPHHIFIPDLNVKIIENELAEEYGWFVPTDNEKVQDRPGLMRIFSQT